MKRAKTYLRSAMTSSSLNNLPFLSIEREISGIFIENPSAVIDELASMKKKKMEFLI